MAFEWDDAKQLSNLMKHDIDFSDAQLLFDGRPVVVLPGTNTDEERFLTVGLLDNRFMTVVWTRREANIRIISARRSRHAEKRIYQSVHGRGT